MPSTFSEETIEKMDYETLESYQKVDELMTCDICGKEQLYADAGPETMGVEYFLRCNSIYPTFLCPVCKSLIDKRKIPLEYYESQDRDSLETMQSIYKENSERLEKGVIHPSKIESVKEQQSRLTKSIKEMEGRINKQYGKGLP